MKSGVSVLTPKMQCKFLSSCVKRVHTFLLCDVSISEISLRISIIFLIVYFKREIVIYEPSAGRRCSRMSAFFKARATKERVPLINARMNGRCLHASGSYNIFCTKIK
jgi:hypothetical protein